MKRIDPRIEEANMTIYRCGECGLESSDKDIVGKCIRDHTKLKLDRIEQR